MMNRITNESPVKGESCLSFAAVDASSVIVDPNVDSNSNRISYSNFSVSMHCKSSFFRAKKKDQ